MEVVFRERNLRWRNEMEKWKNMSEKQAVKLRKSKRLSIAMGKRGACDYTGECCVPASLLLNYPLLRSYHIVQKVQILCENFSRNVLVKDSLEYLRDLIFSVDSAVNPNFVLPRVFDKLLVPEFSDLSLACVLGMTYYTREIPGEAGEVYIKKLMILAEQRKNYSKIGFAIANIISDTRLSKDFCSDFIRDVFRENKGVWNAEEMVYVSLSLSIDVNFKVDYTLVLDWVLERLKVFAEYSFFDKKLYAIYNFSKINKYREYAVSKDFHKVIFSFFNINLNENCVRVLLKILAKMILNKRVKEYSVIHSRIISGFTKHESFKVKLLALYVLKFLNKNDIDSIADPLFIQQCINGIIFSSIKTKNLCSKIIKNIIKWRCHLADKFIKQGLLEKIAESIKGETEVTYIKNIIKICYLIICYRKDLIHEYKKSSIFFSLNCEKFSWDSNTELLIENLRLEAGETDQTSTSILKNLSNFKFS